jgi:hypothetical protein
MDWYLSTFFPTMTTSVTAGGQPSYIYFADKVARRMRADLGAQDLRSW